MVPTSPVDGCGLFDKADGVSGKIPIILRGGCMFVDKVGLLCSFIVLVNYLHCSNSFNHCMWVY